jgi:hypothetical protein
MEKRFDRLWLIMWASVSTWSSYDRICYYIGILVLPSNNLKTMFAVSYVCARWSRTNNESPLPETSPYLWLLWLSASIADHTWSLFLHGKPRIWWRNISSVYFVHPYMYLLKNWSIIMIRRCLRSSSWSTCCLIFDTTYLFYRTWFLSLDFLLRTKLLRADNFKKIIRQFVFRTTLSCLLRTLILSHRDPAADGCKTCNIQSSDR